MASAPDGFRFRELDSLKPTSFVEAVPAAIHEIPDLVAFRSQLQAGLKPDE